MLAAKHGVNMTDRISEILSQHIALARRQLAYMREGTTFDNAGPIPVTEADLMARIGELEAALNRHEVRNG